MGIQPAEIVTARELGSDERQSLVAEVANSPAANRREFQARHIILGGAVVRIGSTVYDGSVRGRLDRLKEA